MQPGHGGASDTSLPSLIELGTLQSLFKSQTEDIGRIMQSGLASDDSESEDEDGIDPYPVAEAAVQAGHLDGLSDTLKEWLPILICLDQQKQTICIKLINKMLESPR